MRSTRGLHCHSLLLFVAFVQLIGQCRCGLSGGFLITVVPRIKSLPSAWPLCRRRLPSYAGMMLPARLASLRRLMAMEGSLLRARPASVRQIRRYDPVHGQGAASPVNRLMSDLEILFKRALFARIVADGDMHLKNLALLKVTGPRSRQVGSVRVAPLYDAVTTRVFPEPSGDRMAFKLEGRRRVRCWKGLPKSFGHALKRWGEVGGLFRRDAGGPCRMKMSIAPTLLHSNLLPRG